MDPSPQAKADLAWLRRRLGATRVPDPWMTDENDAASDWCVEIVKSDGKRMWFYAETLPDALAHARAAVQSRTGRKP